MVYRANGPEREGLHAGFRDESESIGLHFAGYGYRRVAREVKRSGFSAGLKTFANVLRENSIRADLKTRWAPTADLDLKLKSDPSLAKEFVL